MDLVSVQEYTEELPLFHLNHEQYLSAAQRAAVKLHWLVAAADTVSITCYTPGGDQSAGEMIIITPQRKTATFLSRPVNEYYWDEVQNRSNAGRFKQAIILAIEEQDKADRNLHPMHREKWGALVPSKSYLVTPLLVYANVLVYVAMVVAGLSPMQPTAQSLLEWGGNFRPAVVDGQWWRLISYMFLHGGLFHLLMNAYALLYIGMFLEPLMGRLRFASAYVLAGVCAGLLSIVVHGFSVGVGASGAIFGMYGVFLSMLTTNHIQPTYRKTMLRSILFFVVLNLLYGLQGNVDNAAHIGGLASGFVMGYVYYPGIAAHAKTSRQVVVSAAIAAVVVLIAVCTLLLI